MKHRHRLQQRRRTTSASRPSEVHEESDEQVLPGTRRSKKRAHAMSVEGNRTRHRFDKQPRSGRRPKRVGPQRFEDGGTVGPPLSLNAADYSNVGINGQGQWVDSNTGKLLDQPPELSESGQAYMRQAAQNPDVTALVNRVKAMSELGRVMGFNADATSIPDALGPRQSGGRISKGRAKR